MRLTKKTRISGPRGEEGEEKKHKAERGQGSHADTLRVCVVTLTHDKSRNRKTQESQIWRKTVSSLGLPEAVFCLPQMSAIKANGRLFLSSASNIFLYFIFIMEI